MLCIKSILCKTAVHCDVQVLAAANATVANNNDGGIAEAIERFIL